MLPIINTAKYKQANINTAVNITSNMIAPIDYGLNKISNKINAMAINGAEMMKYIATPANASTNDKAISAKHIYTMPKQHSPIKLMIPKKSFLSNSQYKNKEYERNIKKTIRSKI